MGFLSSVAGLGRKAGRQVRNDPLTFIAPTSGFSQGLDAVAVPDIPAPGAIPGIDSSGVLSAGRGAGSRERRRKGRASTMLTDLAAPGQLNIGTATLLSGG